VDSQLAIKARRFPVLAHTAPIAAATHTAILEHAVELPSMLARHQRSLARRVRADAALRFCAASTEQSGPQ
jgi:hypothetical protein